MEINLKAARYVLACVEAIVAEKLPVEAKRDICPECMEKVTQLNSSNHIVRVSIPRDEVVLIIGCEGYWVIDPNLVGMNDSTWLPPEIYDMYND